MHGPYRSRRPRPPPRFPHLPVPPVPPAPHPAERDASESDGDLGVFEVGAGLPGGRPFLRATVGPDAGAGGEAEDDDVERSVVVRDRFARLDAGLPPLPPGEGDEDESLMPPLPRRAPAAVTARDPLPHLPMGADVEPKAAAWEPPAREVPPPARSAPLKIAAFDPAASPPADEGDDGGEGVPDLKPLPVSDSAPPAVAPVATASVAPAAAEERPARRRGIFRAFRG